MCLFKQAVLFYLNCYSKGIFNFVQIQLSYAFYLLWAFMF